jgi:hypothetical protein
MVTVAMGEDVMSHKTVATEGYNSDGGSVTPRRSHYRNGSQDAVAKVEMGHREKLLFAASTTAPITCARGTCT